ncbi:50S ribosomal subunit protein L9 [Gammaproteobacteria bacterium]
MEVILLEKLKNLGPLGARVKVKPGYARNFLIPKGKATPATAANMAAFEARRLELERAESDLLDAARRRSEALTALGLVVIRQRAGAEGRLFGSVGTADVAFALTDAGVDVNKSEIRLPNGPLRIVGDHEVSLHLHTEVDVIVTISVVAEG